MHILYNIIIFIPDTFFDIFYFPPPSRVKMCTSVSEGDLMTAHHEMGHVEYYMMYRQQPCIYRTGANAAFHEAVGDTVQLSAMTPEYLYRIKLAPYDAVDGGVDIQNSEYSRTSFVRISEA